MKAAFYCRIGNQVFACVLPDERHKLRAFLNAEQKREAQESPKRIAISNLKKDRNFFVVGLTYG